MLRKAVLALGVVLTFCSVHLVFAADAARASRLYRVGVLSPGAPPLGPLEAFQEGLRDFGYIDGRTLAIDWRFAGGRNDVLPQLARELADAKVDVIVAINTQAAEAAKKATSQIPIVFVRGADPVRTGLVASFARPGGNVTGITALADELGGKQLELLKETVPRVARVATLWNAGNPGTVLVARDLAVASHQLGLQVESLPVETPGDFPRAVQVAIERHVDALVVVDDVFVTTHAALLFELANRKHLPVTGFFREFAEAGALLAYGPDIPAIYRRAAYFVDRILKGARPADLPVEQPTKFELVINLKTAKALGITIPQSLLLRADEVIQ